jgi:hypothetical protein
MIVITRYVTPVMLRTGIYAIAFSLLITGIMLLPSEAFYENRLVEWIQVSLLTAGAALFVYAGLSGASSGRTLPFVLAGVLVMAAIRELDCLLDTYAGDSSWQVCVALVFAVTAIHLLRNFRQFMDSLRELTSHAAFGLLVAGVLALFFSRITGHNDFWDKHSSKEDLKLLLRIMEETTELLAYSITLIGAIEYAIAASKRPGR